jgi:hypothetical protein
MSSVIFTGSVFVVCTGVAVICSINASYYNRILKADGAESQTDDPLVSAKMAQVMLAMNLILAIVAAVIVLVIVYSAGVTMYNKVCIGGPRLPQLRFGPGSPGAVQIPQVMAAQPLMQQQSDGSF